MPHEYLEMFLTVSRRLATKLCAKLDLAFVYWAVMWSETVGLRTRPVRDQKDRKEFDLVYTTGTDDGLLKVYGKIHTGA